MAYIRVRDKVTNKIVRIPEEDMETYGARYELLSAPGGGGFLASLAKPFTRTGERVSGVGESLLRKYMADQAEEALARGDYDEAQRLSQMGGKDSALTRGEGKDLTDPLQVAKDSLAMLSWGVPVGKFAKPWQGGAIAGGMGGFGYGEGETAGEILGQTALGAGTGAATSALLSKFFPGKKPPVEGEEQLGKTGQVGMDFKRAAMRPQAGGTANKVMKEDQIIKEAMKRKITGAPQNMRYKIAAKYQPVYDDVARILSDNPGKSYSAETVKKWIRNRIVGMEGRSFIPDDAAFERYLARELAVVDSFAKNGRIDASGMLKAINRINSNSAKIYQKAGGEVTSAVLNQEGVRMDVNKALHEILNEVGPEGISKNMQEMSTLNKIARGVNYASLEQANLFGVPIEGTGRLALGGFNRLGDLLVGADKLGQGISTKAPMLETAAGGKVPALAAFLTSGKGMPKGEAVPETVTGPQVETTPEGLGLTEQDMLLLSMLPAKAQNDIFEKIITDRIVGTMTASDKKRAAAISSVEITYKQLEEAAVGAPTGVLGAGLSTLGYLPGFPGGKAEDLRRITQGYAKQIAAAFAGEVGVATDKDVERWLGLMPKPGDTRAERLRALQRLREQIDAEKARLGM